MAVIKLKDQIYFTGAFNPALRIFDIVMETKYGTTYNSYIVKGSEKTALIETCHDRFFDIFTDNIKEICDFESLDYIVLNHTEPDHTGSLEKLLRLAPNASVVSSQAGAIYLKNITNMEELKVTIVKDGDTISLGDKTLQFINAPFLHWPDSMFTFVPESKILFSCDFLGTHYCEPAVFDTKVKYPEKYEESFKGYYDAIFGPFPSYVQRGLAKIKDIDADMIAPSHGPVLTKGNRIAYAKEKYDLWSQPQKNEKLTIPIFYCSAYGCTKNLAVKIREGILSMQPGAKVELFDLIENDISDMACKLNASDGFLIGSPTINRDAVPPVWVLLSCIDAINCAKKPCAVFGSYGWSGEAAAFIAARLSGLKLNVSPENYRVSFVPSDKELVGAYDYGCEFAKKF